MYTTTRTDLKRRSNEFRRPPCDRRPHRPHQGVEDARLSPGPSLPAPFQSVLSFQHDDPSPNSATVDRFCRRVFTSQERSRGCCFGSGFSLPACCRRLLRATACVVRQSLSSSGSGVPWCGCRGLLVHSSPCTELFLLNSDVSGFCFTVCPFYVLLKNLPHLELRKFFFFLLRCLLKVWVLALSILILIKKQLKGGY